MAANEVKHWFNGLPSEGVEISANDSGTVKYWFNGLPSEQIFSTAGAPAATTSKLLLLLGVGS